MLVSNHIIVTERLLINYYGLDGSVDSRLELFYLAGGKVPLLFEECL